MKNFIYKLLKKNENIYDHIFNKMLEDRKIEAITKLVNDKRVIKESIITDKNINLENCIVINTRIENCNIEKITDNLMDRVVLSMNRIGKM